MNAQPYDWLERIIKVKAHGVFIMERDFIVWSMCDKNMTKLYFKFIVVEVE